MNKNRKKKTKKRKMQENHKKWTNIVDILSLERSKIMSIWFKLIDLVKRFPTPFSHFLFNEDSSFQRLFYRDENIDTAENEPPKVSRKEWVPDSSCPGHSFPVQNIAEPWDDEMKRAHR
jgi:hypothetical protein